MTAATGAFRPGRRGLGVAANAAARRNAWTVGLVGLLIAFLALTKFLQPNYAAAGIQGLAISILPIAFAAVAQAIVVISGGIDLSVGSMMALASVTSAVLMKDQGDAFGVAVVIGVLLLGLAVGAINGSLIVATKVPDIVVTLAMSFVWAGTALLILNTPGGGAAPWMMAIISGPLGNPWLPKSLVVLAVLVAVIWLPLRRSRLGLELYAVGSHTLSAFRSGVAVGRTKIIAYALTGLFSALGGLALTATGGVGAPVPGSYTLQSVAAIVLGGVSLAGGRGGVLGPIIAVIILALVRTDLFFAGVDPNWSTAIQGAILIGVVMFGSIVAMRKRRS
ncbi:MAG: ribose transport system permease protein [Chloroflexota bacterium]|jgi:ribose transport system permease protein|nr:ribose transport system permease protein [Chloroflexota bacterium]